MAENVHHSRRHAHHQCQARVSTRSFGQIRWGGTSPGRGVCSQVPCTFMAVDRLVRYATGPSEQLLRVIQLRSGPCHKTRTLLVMPFLRPVGTYS